MQVFVVPMRNDVPAYRFKIDFSGVIFTFRARFNTRMQRWVYDLADPSNNDILVGQKVLIRTAPVSQFVIPGLPAGVLIPEDNRNNVQGEPTRNSFGTTHSMLYVDPTQ